MKANKNSLPHAPQDSYIQSPQPEWGRGQRGFACRSDWEAMKFIIESLYFYQNLNLQDVMKIMEVRHNFRATKKMYKNHFAKWGWQKYNLSEASKNAAVTRSCLRQRQSRTQALLHESASSRLLNETLTHLRNFVEVRVPHDLAGRPISKFAWAGLSTSDPSICNGIQAAMRRFDQGDFDNGGKILRHAFLRVEDALREPGFNAAFDLLVVPVCYILINNRLELLEAFLVHVETISAALGAEHSIRLATRALLALARHGEREVRQFVSAALELRSNTVASNLGEVNRSVIGLRQLCLNNQINLGVRSRECEWQIKDFAEQYRALIQEAVDATDNEAFLQLEDELSLLQYRNSVYLDGFDEHTQRLLQHLAMQYNVNSRGKGWDSVHAELYLDFLSRLIHYCLQIDQAERALKLLVDLFAFSAEPRDRWIITRLNFVSSIERDLKNCGAIEEAKELGMLWQNTQTYQFLCLRLNQADQVVVEEASQPIAHEEVGKTSGE